MLGGRCGRRVGAVVPAVDHAGLVRVGGGGAGVAGEGCAEGGSVGSGGRSHGSGVGGRKTGSGGGSDGCHNGSGGGE